MLEPGTHGEACDKLTQFDTPASLLLDGTRIPRSWTRKNFGSTGSQQVICPGILDTVAQMRPILARWNASKRKRGFVSIASMERAADVASA